MVRYVNQCYLIKVVSLISIEREDRSMICFELKFHDIYSIFEKNLFKYIIIIMEKKLNGNINVMYS